MDSRFHKDSESPKRNGGNFPAVLREPNQHSQGVSNYFIDVIGYQKAWHYLVIL